jgi:hypothetical protein
MLRISLAIGMGLEANIAVGLPVAGASADFFFLELAVSM